MAYISFVKEWNLERKLPYKDALKQAREDYYEKKGTYKVSELDEDDLRYKLKNKYTNIDFNIDNFDKNELNKLLQSLDVTDTEENYCGLPLYVKQFYLSDNDYENLYLHFNELIINEF